MMVDRIMAFSSLLEVLNGAWAILCLCCMTVFGVYIYDEFTQHGWRAYWPISGAIAIFVTDSGEFIFRSLIWWWRHEINHGIDAAWVITSPALIIGSIVAMLGLICKIRVFSPRRIRAYAWIISAGLGLAASIAGLFSSGLLQ